MDETIEYWQRCLEDFELALEQELLMPELTSDMYRLLKEEITLCISHIKELS